MRTKHPTPFQSRHFMFIDSLESHHTEDTEPVKMLVKQKVKQVPEVESSPTTIFAPMSAPPAMKLPEALPEPRLPRASVWGSASPMLKRVWSSSREHEVMEEWLDEVELPNNAKMVLKGASAWPEKDREYKTKHARLHDKFWAKKRKEKKHARERTALAEHEHELARLNDAGDATPAASQKTLYLLHKSAARKPPHKNAPRRAKVRRDQRRASRSARSFDLDDGENLVWVMSQKQIERRREVAAALAVAAMQYDVKRAMTLLHREPKGPALAELFKRGVPLSIKATKDLTDLLERKPLPKMRSTKPGNKPGNKLGHGHARGGKGGKPKARGAGAERHAASNGMPGKRRS